MTSFFVGNLKTSKDVLVNYAELITAPSNNMPTLRFRGKLAISFYAVVNHHCNGHPKAETNKLNRNPPITTQQHELLNPLKQ